MRRISRTEWKLLGQIFLGTALILGGWLGFMYLLVYIIDPY